MVDLNLNVNGDARRARAALNDVASGSERAARVADHLSRSFDHLERQANDAQDELNRLNRELANNGPSAELSAELDRVQRQLADIAHERGVAENLRAQFRRSTAAAATLDHQLAATRRELDRLNDEFSRGGDPAVLRRIQEQQRELARLNSIRRRIGDEDEANQRRLARIAEEARRAQRRRDDEDEHRRSRTFLGRARRLGDNLGNSLQGASPPPTAVAVGGAIGAAAAVPLLAAIGGAITGAAGAGIAGLGIAGAIMGDPEKFKAEWASATGTVKDEFLDATKVFAGPTLDAIRGIGPLVESWHLDDTFAGAAKFVPTIVRGVEGFATGIVRGVSAMVDKGEPAVEALSAGLAELGDAAGDAFTSIADGAEGGGEALRDVLFLTGDLIRVFGAVTGAAEDFYGYVHDHPIEAAVNTAGLSLTLTLLDQFSGKSDQVSGTITDLGVAGASAFYGLDQKARDALATVDRLNDSFNTTRDRILGLSNANIAVANDLRDLKEAFTENGKTIDINTQKGADNLAVINQTVDDLLRQRDAAIAAGGGTQEAYDKANAAFNRQLANLEAMVAKLLGSKKAAHDLFAEFYDRTVTVTVKVRQVGNVSVDGVISGGDQRRNTRDAYAVGGTVTGTGPMLVGELGPEVVWGDRGQYVSTAAQTQRLVSAMSRGASVGGGGSSGPARLVVSGGGEFGSFIQKLVDTGQIQLFVGDQPVTAR